MADWAFVGVDKTGRILSAMAEAGNTSEQIVSFIKDNLRQHLRIRFVTCEYIRKLAMSKK